MTHCKFCQYAHSDEVACEMEDLIENIMDLCEEIEELKTAAHYRQDGTPRELH